VAGRGIQPDKTRLTLTADLFTPGGDVEVNPGKGFPGFCMAHVNFAVASLDFDAESQTAESG